MTGRALGVAGIGTLDDHGCLLAAAYLTLIKDVQWKVRKSLAHSLHEVARIVQTEVTEKTLTQAFDLFLKDLDEVKVGMVGRPRFEARLWGRCYGPTQQHSWETKFGVFFYAQSAKIWGIF